MKVKYTCRKWIDQLIKSPEELTEQETHDLWDHLSLCSQCLAKYEVYHEMAKALHTLSSAEPLPSLLLLLQDLKEAEAKGMLDRSDVPACKS